MAWTADQSKAIETHRKNLLVNAAAAEMRSRIHAVLAKKISEGGAPDILDRLERQSIIVICINRRALLSSPSQERTLSHGLDRRSI